NSHSTAGNFKNQHSMFNDLQKLFGTINWICPLLGITTEELSPLFQLLKWDQDLSSL
ncbi:POK25 protein, partial [Notiomystis cincta]|nr:POK25 protein [Notiomystis cincta]